MQASSLCFVTALMTCALITSLTPSGTAADNSASVRSKGRSLGALESRGKGDPETCRAVLRKCKHDKSCSRALQNLDKKCTVKAGQCAAKMKDLEECAEIMDVLTKKIFDTRQKCVCQRSAVRCSTIHNRVYENACFKSVSYLRNINLLPRIEASKQQPETVVRNDDVIDTGLLDTLMTYEDYKSEEVAKISTPVAPSENVETTFTVNEVITETRRLKDSDVISVDDDAFRGPVHNLAPHDDGVLLHVVAIATGVLVLLTLAVGASLVVYFSMRKSTMHDEKKQPTMT